MDVQLVHQAPTEVGGAEQRHGGGRVRQQPGHLEDQDQAMAEAGPEQGCQGLQQPLGQGEDREGEEGRLGQAFVSPEGIQQLSGGRGCVTIGTTSLLRQVGDRLLDRLKHYTPSQLHKAGAMVCRPPKTLLD